MPGFTPHCPRCGPAEVKQVGRNDRYPLTGRRLDTPPIAATFVYKCQCGLAFAFDVTHGEPPKKP
jgi:hypothetical protein